MESVVLSDFERSKTHYHGSLTIFSDKPLMRSSYCYYFTLCEVFTPASSGGFSLQPEWQQVSSGLQDFSQYSSWSQDCCSLDGLHSSSDFQIFHSSFQVSEDRSKNTNNNWYHRHPQAPYFLALCQGSILLLLVVVVFNFRFFTILDQTSLLGLLNRPIALLQRGKTP